MSARIKLALVAVVVATFLLGFYSLQYVRTAAQAYVYGYPLVLMEKTRVAMADNSAPNGFSHAQVFPDHNFRKVIRPNNDTLYSIAWLDLSHEPVILSVPDTEDRYYVMPLMDAWTNVFARIGKGTTGTGAGDYLLAGPQWSGDAPDGMEIIRAPTAMVWMLGRIQTNGRKDMAAVGQLQQQFQLTQLSKWASGEAIVATMQTSADQDKSSDPYLEITQMSGVEFFAKLAALMGGQLPAEADGPMLETLAGLGLVPGEAFSAGPVKRYLLDYAKAQTHEAILRELARNSELENGWGVRRELIGSYGTYYGVRAGVAMIGLGALPPEEAVYPNARVDANGETLNGSNRYRIHFPAGKTPPSGAFWSVTMYDHEGFLVDNPIGRYAIGDRDPLQFNPDGSLDLLIQHEKPAAMESNWLPAPKGTFALTMRIYLPGKDFLDASWKLPPIEPQ